MLGSLLLAQTVFGEPCTRETCPNEPVIAYFQYGNCSGDVIYQRAADVYDSCVPDGSSSFRNRALAHGFSTYRWMTSPDCGTSGTGTGMGTTYYYGVCQPRWVMKRAVPVGMIPAYSGSMVYLPNANASFAPNQMPYAVDSQNYPNIDETRTQVTCYGASNCSASGYEWYATYPNDTCVEGDFTGHAFTSIQVGACYSRSTDYMSVGCLNSYTTYYDTFVGGPCERKFSTVYQIDECGSGRTVTLHCAATPTPQTELPPYYYSEPEPAPETSPTAQAPSDQSPTANPTSSGHASEIASSIILIALSIMALMF